MTDNAYQPSLFDLPPTRRFKRVTRAFERLGIKWAGVALPWVLFVHDLVVWPNLPSSGLTRTTQIRIYKPSVLVAPKRGDGSQ